MPPSWDVLAAIGLTRATGLGSLPLSSTRRVSPRMADGQEAEAQVKAGLEGIGWTVHPYGQALLTAAVRETIRKFNIPDRWLSDFLVVRPTGCALLVDAKAARAERANYAVEMRSLLSARILGSTTLEHDPLPKWYVASDGGAWSPQQAVDQDVCRGCCLEHVTQLRDFWYRPIIPGLWDGGLPPYCARRAAGSRTPFVLIPKADCRPVFPARVQAVP